MSQMTIGQILVEEGLVTQAQLEEALKIQQDTGRRLGNILTTKGFLPEDVFAQALSRQLDVPYFDLDDYIIDPAVVSILPEHICERYRLIPIMKHSDRLVVAFADPLNQDALADIGVLTSMQIRVVVSTPSAINRALSLAFDALSSNEEWGETIWGAVPPSGGAGGSSRKVPRK